MIIYDNLTETFYQKILKKCSVSSRVLLICALDVDALCACKILQKLFNCDNLQSSIKPVCSNEELYTNYHKHRNDHDFVILVNCGGTVDLGDLLTEEAEDEDEEVLDFEDHGVEVFVLDSHRPLSLINVFTDKPITMVLKECDGQGFRRWRYRHRFWRYWRYRHHRHLGRFLAFFSGLWKNK